MYNIRLSSREKLSGNKVSKLMIIVGIPMVGAIVGISVARTIARTSSILVTVINKEVVKTKAIFFAFRAIVI